MCAYSWIAILFKRNCIQRSRSSKEVWCLLWPGHCADWETKSFWHLPNWVVSYIAYTKFHSPRPVFHCPAKFSLAMASGRALVSQPAVLLWLDESWNLSTNNLWGHDPNFVWSRLVTILNLSWQLCCRDMCKIVTWSDHYFSSKSIIHSCKFWINELIKCLWHVSSILPLHVHPVSKFITVIRILSDNWYTLINSFLFLE